MRRWFWTAAVAAGLGLSQAHADYIVIRLNIGGKSSSDSSGTGSGMPFGPGMPGGAGGPGMPGGAGGRGPGGSPPGGMPGMPGPGMGPGMGPGGMPGMGPGGGGRGGIPGPGGMPGMGGGRGGIPGPGGMPGMGPGGGGRGGIPGPGGPGGGMPGMPGPGMGPGGGRGPGGMPGPGGPGGGMPGMPGGPGMGPGGPGLPGGAGGPGMPGPGGVGGTANDNGEFDTFETVVLAIVELTDPRKHPNEAMQNLGQYKHKWGQTALFNDGETLQSWHLIYKTPLAQLNDKKKNLRKSAEDYLSLATEALTFGLNDECIKLIAEAGAMAEPSPKAKAQLAACAQIKAALEKPFEGSDAVNTWRERLGADKSVNFQAAYSTEGHYAVFYEATGAGVPEEVTRLLGKLERQMQGFYLWFALKGKALPIPREKLVAVQVRNADKFKAQRSLLDLPGISEGFFAPRDNVAVFSTKRLDEGYVTFSSHMETFWSDGWNREELLRGKQLSQMKTAIKKSGGTQAEFLKRDYPRMQTLALLEKALEEESERAAVSFEGTRQLAVASGVIRQNVVLPEWVSFGFASLFETPKGPFAGADGTAQVAFWTSIGGPNWAYVRQIKKWANSKDEFTKMDPAPEALKRTVTDAYFNRARLPQNLEIDPKLSKSDRERREKEIARAKEATYRAKAHAWALNAYLAKNKLDDYLAFLTDLGNLPRDMELDDATMLLVFARAFKLTNAAGDMVDQGKFSAFAFDWLAEINKFVEPARDAKLEREKPHQAGGGGATPPGVGPGGGGRPGYP